MILSQIHRSITLRLPFDHMHPIVVNFFIINFQLFPEIICGCFSIAVIPEILVSD